MKGKLRGNRTLSGTHGKVWIDGILAFECYKIEAKISFNREDVQLDLDVDSKITGAKGEITLGFKKVYSTFLDKFEDYKNGKDTRMQVICSLEDPDAVDGQIERYSIDNVWLSELPMFSFEKGGIIEQEFSGGFTPSDMINLDKIA